MRAHSCRSNSLHVLLVLLSCSSLGLFQGCKTARTIPPTTTRWQKLGIPQAVGGLTDSLVNRRGNTPKLERKPPLKRIADPENLASDNPAIKAAAKIKEQEDLAKQKIKALKYLTEIGCSGCYDKDGLVEDAILAGLNDCTADVRMTAIEVILELVENCKSEAAYGKSCSSGKRKKRLGKGDNKLCSMFAKIGGGGKSSCSSGCCGTCCTEKIQEKLSEMAYEEKNGCWLEPSQEIREKAKQALCKCPCPIVDCEEPEEPTKAEPKNDKKLEELPPGSSDSDEDSEDEEGSVAYIEDRQNNKVQILRLVKTERTTERPTTLPRVIRRVVAHSPQNAAGDFAPSNEEQVTGIVEFLDSNDGAALVTFKGTSKLPLGKGVTCLIEDLDKPNKMLAVPCTVVHTKPGMLGLKPLNHIGRQKLQPGVRVLLKNNQDRVESVPQPQKSKISLISRTEVSSNETTPAQILPAPNNPVWTR